jgi:hypothetical protein
MYKQQANELRVPRKLECRKQSDIAIRTLNSTKAMTEFLAVLPAATRTFVKEMVLQGGFIAGGIARYYLNIKLIQKKQFTQKTFYSYVALGGDIDIFFQSDDQYETVVKGLYARKILHPKSLENGFQIGTSAAGFATNIRMMQLHNLNDDETPGVVFGYKDIKIQLIGCETGLPAKVISYFDFRNCMAAFDNHNVYVANDWEHYEARRELDVTSWESQFLIWRMVKYMHKYGYKKLSKTSLLALTHEVQKMVETFSGVNNSHSGQFVTRNELGGQLLRIVKGYRDRITKEDALLLSAFARICGHEVNDMYLFRADPPVYAAPIDSVILDA